ncbi:hypothetical protein [Comamonas granuli]|uniref:hypothetical protein n=1 Tax=Comamonas granuli TaxID=290309 RepID=UPI0012EC205C|nr:hypothetical protein [Comamonas granuli]
MVFSREENNRRRFPAVVSFDGYKTSTIKRNLVAAAVGPGGHYLHGAAQIG